MAGSSPVIRSKIKIHFLVKWIFVLELLRVFSAIAEIAPAAKSHQRDFAPKSAIALFCRLPRTQIADRRVITLHHSRAAPLPREVDFCFGALARLLRNRGDSPKSESPPKGFCAEKRPRAFLSTCANTNRGTSCNHAPPLSHRFATLRSVFSFSSRYKYRLTPLYFCAILTLTEHYNKESNPPKS